MDGLTAILGISAFYHDSAAALVVDGEIVAASQEERYTRRRHDADFPDHAIEQCLRQAGLRRDQLDYVAYYEKPLTKFDRLLQTYLAYTPAGFPSFRVAMPVWMRTKIHLRRLLRSKFRDASKVRLVFTDHHESHAASAFFPSPFDQAAFLTLDGVGEWSCTTFGSGSGNRIEFGGQMRFPHSLGLLYSAFTYYCGFRVNSGEYKLMGLAPYGRPVFADLIRRELIDLRSDGSFRLNLRYFDFCEGLRMVNERFEALFGGPARPPESNLEQRHMDLAASIQVVLEDIVLRIVGEVHRRTGMDRLVLAGGVALNCVANGRILREGPFRDIWVQPAAGDAGGALGAALFVWHQLLGRPRLPDARDSQKGSLLGPSFSSDEIQRILEARGRTGHRFADERALLDEVSRHLAEGRIVGWFQGRMEFGPRALGARSILGDPRNPATQATMNLKIKFRESFRPFAPCVLRERASEHFDIAPEHESPYMLIVAPVHERHRVPLSASDRTIMEESPDLRERVRVPRSHLPAITHVDYSARIQTVDAERHGRFHRLLEAFERLTGCPVLVNTSFNVRGEPIVCNPDDALRCFHATEMDVLVLEDFVLVKTELERQAPATERERHLSRFDLD